MIAVVLAIPVSIVLMLLCGVVTMMMVGPWGGALDGVDDSKLPGYTQTLGYVLWFVVIGGSLLIGWRYAGKFTEPGTNQTTKPRDQ